MAQPRTLALDAMGGDRGPEVVIPGAAISLTRHPELNFIFCGDEALIAPLLEGRRTIAQSQFADYSHDPRDLHDGKAKPGHAPRQGFVHVARYRSC